MNEQKSQKPTADHWIIEKPASENQVLISSGEEILEYVQRLAHQIENQVRQALNSEAGGSDSRP